MSSKPRLSFWQIWNMCFGFLGIQFGFALQNANVSRIFQTLGAEVDDIPALWIAAPLTGLLVQPLDRLLLGSDLDATRAPPTLFSGRCDPRQSRPDRDALLARICGSRRACCGFWMRRSMSRWSRSAPMWAINCLPSSVQPATPCRASSSGSVRWWPAHCPGC
jgi:hypothetical protein